MIIGIGTDIIEIDRVRHAVGHDLFRKKVFTLAEQNYCDGRGVQAAASYAARFAAKEAFFKALGSGIFTKLTDVEVKNNSQGQPEIFLFGAAEKFSKDKGVEKIFLSLSHSKDFATAVCLLCGKNIP